MRWLNYYGPSETFPSVSFHQALHEDGVAPGYFKDKIVLIGGRPVTSGLTLGHDEFANPYSRWGHLFMTGLEVHATEFSNLYHGDWLVRMPRLLEIALFLGCGLLIGALASLVSPRKGIAGMVVVAIVVAVAGCCLVWQARMWFNWLIPVLVQVPMGIMWSVGTQSVVEARKRRALRQAFSLYLSPHMADRIADSEFDLKPGAQVVEATVVFTDLKGFTAMADELNDPLRLSHLLIDYFTQTSGCILENDGTIIKYLGDAVLAAWGAPLPDAEHASKAALAAWQLCEASKLVVGGRVLTTRIGLSTGMVAAGNIGSPFRFDYSVIGDTVNLASRFEGLNKILGTSILVSEATRERIKERFVTRYLGHFTFAGKVQSVPVHELIRPKSEETGDLAWIATFEEAVGAIKRGAFEEARSLLRKTAWERGGQDSPSEFYLKKIDDLEKRGDLQTWTGAVRLSEK
ncbi:MAG: adenylate/guanylate cyclase domain-containing protein [Planctomycetaceae bacterium]|nr:adenylate/guanylate cyclase domain-containing protein [Planctomycetaceae bacterium]